MSDTIDLPDVSVTADAPHGALPRQSRPSTPDVLSLIVGGQEWQGWQRVAVTRNMETVPASFDVEVTEHYPTTGDIAIKPGDPCQVKIGGDLVITGYVDRYTAAFGPYQHTVRIEGRSKSEDLVDCAAFVGSKDNPTYQIMGGTTLSIAQQLAKPYGVTISSTAGDGVQIPRFNINLGETAWEIIDRVTRYSQLIAYDLTDGSVQLSQVGTKSMGSGFRQGDNVEQANVIFSMDQRYSVYEGHLLSTQAYFTDQGVSAPDKGTIVTDDGVPRFRKRIIISEQMQLGEPIVKQRVIWERNRRAARSQAVNVTADSWRDASGTLWDINHLAPIELPALKLPQATWVIGQITFTRDEAGQHAHVTLMPKEAFMPEPIVLQPTPVLTSDVEKYNATKPTTPQQ
jgi:prophage tail gpP-like protein